jgi:hypothetical protein
VAQVNGIIQNAALTTGSFNSIGDDAISGAAPLVGTVDAVSMAQPMIDGVDAVSMAAPVVQPSQPPAQSPVQNTTLATYGAGASIASAVASMFGAYFQAKSRKKVAMYQAEIEERNRQMAELSAHMALQQSNWYISQKTQQAGQLKATQRVRMGASGVKVGVGNSKEVLASTEIIKQIDVNQQYVNGYREAWGIRSRGLGSAMQASAARSYASSISPIGSALATVPGALLQTYKTWHKEFKDGE